MTSTGQSFGGWLRQQRRALDLTQEELAGRVGCSAITLRKLEAEERRPSKQIAERLAEVLNVPADGRADFMRFARGDPFAGPEAAKPADLAAPRHNLPGQLTPFIGREREINEIRTVLDAERLVTLTGTGGAGKTRLSQQVAGGLVDAFPDGLWLVALASLADPALLPQTVANVLGLRERPGEPITARLVDHLRPKRLLLLLDNCEHLVQACAELAESLLQACPRLKILATSREGLGLSGERTYLVPSLSLPAAGATRARLQPSEAARLFVERAAAALPGFSVTDDNAPAVAEICRQLDGLPLAIELAAARVKVLSVEQIAARLDDRFRLLTGGSRTALPRHQTLQALIDWSYDLLPAAEQVMLQRLAVFASGWTIDAAEAVAVDASGVGAVLDRLGRLIDKSLVQLDKIPAPGEARYHLLETIRQYALAKLSVSGAMGAVRQKHAEYYQALWDRNRVGPNDLTAQEWLDPRQIELELDNVRAALTWSQSAQGDAELGLRLSGAVMPSLTGYAEARGWLAAALARAEAQPAEFPQARAVALGRLGVLDGSLADFANARAHLAQSLLLFRELGDQLSTSWALEKLGWVAREQDDPATARLRLGEALAICEELSDKLGIAVMKTSLGEAALMQGDTVEAGRWIEEGLALYREMAAPEGIGWALNHLGQIAHLKGDFEQATKLYQESLALFLRIYDKYPGVGYSHQCLGEVALARGHAVRAIHHFRLALEASRLTGARIYIAWGIAGLACTAVMDEEPERAARLWGAAEALRQSIGAREAPAARALHARVIARARKQLGEADFEAARAEGQIMKLEQAIELAVEAA